MEEMSKSIKKGKLITDGNENYSVLDDKKDLIGTTMESGLTENKLSLKNCQAIKNGYDLDELAENYAKSGLKIDTSYSFGLFYGFLAGYKKCIENFSDKKFSETEIKKALSLRDEFLKEDKSDEEIIQSLQQTEWDVEIEMEDSFYRNDEKYTNEVGSGNYYTHNKKPKLDSEGCIILKPIKNK